MNNVFRNAIEENKQRDHELEPRSYKMKCKFLLSNSKHAQNEKSFTCSLNKSDIWVIFMNVSVSNYGFSRSRYHVVGQSSLQLRDVLKHGTSWDLRERERERESVEYNFKLIKIIRRCAIKANS